MKSHARQKPRCVAIPPPMDPLQLIGSLVAILAVSGLAVWLGLGRAPVLADETQARLAANEAMDGFDPVRFALDRNGKGALLEDETGRLMLLKPHGNFFAGRMLGPEASTRASEGKLHIDCGERRYGTVTLELSDTATWAKAVDRLGASANA